MTVATVAHVRRNPPDRQALVADFLREIEPSTTEPWRERWEHARELAIEDVQVELIEGLRDFAQQFQDQVFKPEMRLEPDEQQAIQAWLATAPAMFRVGGPLARGDREAAAEEFQRNYVELVARLFPDVRAIQRRLMLPDTVQLVSKLWDRVLKWTASTLDRGIDESSDVLWEFLEEHAQLTPEERHRGLTLLRDEMQARVLETFPRTIAGDPSHMLEELR